MTADASPWNCRTRFVVENRTLGVSGRSWLIARRKEVPMLYPALRPLWSNDMLGLDVGMWASSMVTRFLFAVSPRKIYPLQLVGAVGYSC